MKDDKVEESGCGCLIILVLILAGVVYECSQGDDPIYVFNTDSKVTSIKYPNIDMNKWDINVNSVGVRQDTSDNSNPVVVGQLNLTISTQNRFGIIDSIGRWCKIYVFCEPENDNGAIGWVPKKYFTPRIFDYNAYYTSILESSPDFQHRILFTKQSSVISYYILFPNGASSKKITEDFVYIFKFTRPHTCNVFLLDDAYSAEVFKKNDLSPYEEQVCGPHLYAMSTFDSGNSVFWHPYGE